MIFYTNEFCVKAALTYDAEQFEKSTEVKLSCRLTARRNAKALARVKLFEGQGKRKVDAMETHDMFDNSQRILDSSDDDTEKK